MNCRSGDLKFGTANDAKIAGIDHASIVSRIATVFIGGIALGTPNSANPTDQFGFEAQQIGLLKVGGFAISLAAGAANDLAGSPIGVTNDLKAFEVAL